MSVSRISEPTKNSLKWHWEGTAIDGQGWVLHFTRRPHHPHFINLKWLPTVCVVGTPKKRAFYWLSKIAKILKICRLVFEILNAIFIQFPFVFCALEAAHDTRKSIYSFVSLSSHQFNTLYDLVELRVIKIQFELLKFSAP